MNENVMSATELRKMRAEQLKQARNQRYAYADYIRSYNEAQKEIQKQQTVAELQRIWEANEREQQGFLVRSLSTIGDIAANVVTGALKGIEGIYDLGAGLVGAVGGIFSSDFQKSVQKHIAYDFVGTHIGQPLQELTKNSYTADWGWFGQTIENISSGIGQMLPAVAVTLVTGGLGASAAFSQAASLFTLGASAAGNSTEEAFQDENTNYYRGLGYGLASGAVEVATEKMFGGTTKNIFGKGYLDDAAKSAAMSGLRKIAKEAIEEGTEEAVSELVNPLLKNIYKDKGFFEDFLTTEHLKDIGQSAFVGAATSLVYGETLGRIRRSATNISENIQGLEDLAKKEENLWAKNDSSQEEKISGIRQQLYENISKELKSVNPEAREKLLNTINQYDDLKGVFNADGSIVEQSTNQSQNKSKNGVASYNKEAYTPRLRGKENLLLYAPTKLALTAAQVEAKRSFNALNKGKNPANLVFTSKSLGKDSNGQTIQSAFVDGTLYINTKANASQALVQYEMTHSLEGTKAYNKYAEYILKEISNNETLKQKYGDIEELYNKTVESYSKKLLNEEMKKSQKKLTREAIGKIQDIARYSTTQEVIARFTSENLFTNQEQILKFGEQEPGLLKKLSNWIKNKANKLYKGTAEEIETAKFLDKATKLYNKALEQSFSVQFDNKVRDVYNKEKGDSKNGKERRRNLLSDYSEKRIQSKDSSEQIRSVQEKSRESGQRENSKNKREITRRLPTEEKTVRTVKIQQISHEDWNNFEKNLSEKVKSELGIDVEFYDGSAIPPNVKIEEATDFDGFMDSKNNTMYLRSDATLTEQDIIQASDHEGVHHIKAVNPELYQKTETAIINNISVQDYSELEAVYAENYGEVYGEDIDKIREEIIADLVSKRIQATFSNLEEVNNAIVEMYKAFNPETTSKEIESGDLKYSQNMAHDSDGSPLSQKQVDYFKDSKVRDENGNLLVVYHGTNNGGFTTFRTEYEGAYFTENRNYAKEYTRNAELGDNDQIYACYLNIKKIFDTRNAEDRKLYQDKFYLQWGNGTPLTDKGLPDWTDGRDLVEFVKQYGYDGFIVDEGGVPMPNGNVRDRGISYVALYPEQIKNIDNINPTINEDIRYVINKNKDIKDLVVVHNISETKLSSSIELGGLVVPSLAVTKDSIGHENFGNISLIFKSDTINPENRKNKVFSSDVYSKRFPKVVNKFDTDKIYDIFQEKFAESAKITNDLDILRNIETYLENESLSGVVSNLAERDYIKLQFLLDSGKQFEPEYKIYSLKDSDQFVVNRLLENFELVKEYNNDTSEEDIQKLLEIVDNARYDYLMEMSQKAGLKSIQENYKQRAEDIKNTVNMNVVEKYIRLAKEYKENANSKVIDYYATRDKISDLTKNSKKDIAKYVYDILKPYEKGAFFRNDVDIFDRYGNRRSFNQLHDKLNLSNLLDYMSGTVQDTEGFNYGVGNVRSLLAKQFDTLEEIKSHKDKIISKEQMEEFKKASSEAFDAICNKIHEDYFTAIDMIRDMAKTSQSDYAIKNVFKDYYQPEPKLETIEEIKEFFNTLKDYPTEYFEAKPQRIVSFDEVAEVIAPIDTSIDIINFFTEKGIKVELYDESTTKRSDIIKNLPDDIKFALTRGQLKKEMAKASREKVYNKVEAEQAINGILSAAHTDNYVFTTLGNAKKSEIAEKLWIAFNSKDEGFRAGIAFDVADFLIENAAAENMWEGGDISENDMFTVNTLKQYIHKMDLSGIKGEIAHRYDNDKSPYARWGVRKNDAYRGQSPDQIAQELAEYGIQIQATNEADIFFEIDDMYKEALNKLKANNKKYMSELVSKEELHTLRQDIARDVLNAFDKYGSKTKFAKTIEKYQKRIAVLTEQLKDARERNKAVNNLFETVDRVKALEKYKAADIELAPEITKLIGLLKKVKTYRGNLSANIREIMNTYAQEINGKKLYDLIAQDYDGIGNPTAQLIEDIARQRGELTTTELKNLDIILRNFIHNVRNYNRVFFEGKEQNDIELARKAVEETQTAIKVQDEGFKGVLSKFTRWLQAPVWRFERLSSYKKDGIMTRVFRDLQAGNDKKALLRKQIYQHYEQFFKDNKKVINSWHNQTIDIDGIKMSKGQMISLYMLSLRKQAESHLFSDIDGDSGVIRLTNEKYGEKHEFRSALQKGEDVKITRDTITKIENQLTDIDKQYIELTRQFFDGIARDAKIETDMALFGVSNVGEENYIPIRVADDQIYKQLGDESANFNNLFTVYSPSFNKDVKPNANNKIVVENILDIVNRHASQMSAYYGLAVPIKSFNRIFNKKLEDGVKLRSEINKVDSSFEKYVGKLLADLQGNIKERSGIDKIVSKLRGWGARAALGLNLKVLASQFVSLPAAAGVGVKYRNLAKGFSMALAKKTDFDKLTTYAPMLWERFNEGSTIDVGLLKEGKGVLGKIDMWTDLTTAPIGKIDQFVCGAVWNACIEQTKNNPNYENYSEEHYKAAAKLTEEAVIKTQANYTALYRPEILREQNSFLQLSTMFMSEPLQQFSLLTSAFDKIRVAKLQLKSVDAATRAEAESLLKTAKAEAAHAISAVVVDTIILTLIAQAFRWLKGQDDDEDKMQSIIQDFAENYVGMLPFAKDVYSFLQGYDVTNFASSGITNIGQSLKDLYSIVDLLASGKAYDEAQIYGKMRKVLLAITQTTGIPLRNLETYTKGIIEKFSPSSVYKYEKFFYDGTTSSYIKELTAAIESGDDKLADTILDCFLSEEKIPVRDKELRNTLKELYAQGYSVFPRTVGKTITINGETINLTNSQRTRFREVYQQANTVIRSMVNKQAYKKASTEAQAKAISFIYDYYYDYAMEDLTGEDVINEKTKLFTTAISIEDLALIVQQAKLIDSDKDKKGNTINGSRKRKIQNFLQQQNLTAAEKYMIMGYLGYKNSVGEYKVKAYIQRLKLTRKEKEALLKYSGY